MSKYVYSRWQSMCRNKYQPPPDNTMICAIYLVTALCCFPHVRLVIEKEEMTFLFICIFIEVYLNPHRNTRIYLVVLVDKLIYEIHANFSF